ncbi:MAG: hypothetical protein QOJ15_10613 [Bradyrhizobium sp.]|jgi:hypothetical protein|nr:hypothetical protein [Bradyrhizobium sp.]
MIQQLTTHNNEFEWVNVVPRSPMVQSRGIV